MRRRPRGEHDGCGKVVDDDRCDSTDRRRAPIPSRGGVAPGAARAVETAGTLFPGRTAVILCVWPGIDAERVHTTSVEPVREELIAEVRVTARRDAEPVAEEGTNLALRAGLDAMPLVVESTDGVANAIVQLATKEGAAAVVVGRGGGTRLASLMHGSVSRSVIDHSPLAVLVV